MSGSTRRRSGRLAGLAALALALGACGSDDGGPGAFEVTLQGPVALGAAVVEVKGPGIVGFEGSGSTRTWDASSGAGVHRVVLVGTAEGSLPFRVRVEDVEAGAPQVVVLSASDGANELVSASGFTARVVR